MPTEKLPGRFLGQLKGLGQKLEPVTSIGKAGITDALLKSLDEALTKQELVKVRFAHFKEEKKTMAPVLAERTGSHLVMRVGNVVVLYRQNPDPKQRKIVPQA
jgi:RNA-binding protein